MPCLTCSPRTRRPKRRPTRWRRGPTVKRPKFRGGRCGGSTDAKRCKKLRIVANGPKIARATATRHKSCLWQDFAIRRETLRQWSGAGSNRRHSDFQSDALPTELPDLIRSVQWTYGAALAAARRPLTTVRQCGQRASSVPDLPRNESPALVGSYSTRARHPLPEFSSLAKKHWSATPPSPH